MLAGPDRHLERPQTERPLRQFRREELALVGSPAVAAELSPSYDEFYARYGSGYQPSARRPFVIAELAAAKSIRRRRRQQREIVVDGAYVTPEPSAEMH